MRYGTFTREELQHYIDSKEIRNVSITKTYKNGSQNFEAECKCDRCGGTGAYYHYGTCFKCGGSGYISCTGKIATEEQQMKAQAQTEARHQREYQREQEQMRETASKHPVEGKMVAPWLKGAFACEKVIGIEAETEKAYKVIIDENGHLSSTFIPKVALVDIAPETAFPTDLYIKSWYMDRIVGDDEQFVSYRFISESENAYLSEVTYFDLAFGENFTRKLWIPKKCMETAEEHEESLRKEAMSNDDRYEALINFAKDNGIKGVRFGLRVRTVLDKIQEAGLEYRY